MRVKLKQAKTDSIETNLQKQLLLSDKISQIFKSGCQKILLINTLPFNTEHFELRQARNSRYYAWPPYGIAVLCTALRSRGYDVSLIDFNLEILELIDGRKEIDDNETARKVAEDHWKSRLKEAVTNFCPDLVGLTCMFTMGHEMLTRTASFVKDEFKIPVIVGGVHVTNATQFVLSENTKIDFAGLYESDVSFCDFIDIINKKKSIEHLSQIASIVNNEYIAIDARATPTENELNIIPDYDTLQVQKYSALGEVGSYRSWLPNDTRSSSILSNRGCRARCSFCSVRNFNGMGVRARSISSVVDELEQLKKKYNIGHVAWIDDDLFYDQERTLSLFNEMADRKLDIKWCASNGIIASAAAKCPDLIDAAARSGCIGMTFGLESGCDEILRAVHKPSQVRHYYAVGEILKNYPQIFTRGFLIIGFPNETLNQMMKTVKMAQDVGLDWYGIQLLSPLPSTEIYAEMVSLGLIDDINLKKNKEGDGSKLFIVRQGEKQRQKEQLEKNKTETFINLFDGDWNVVPTREQLHDIWLLVDYWINYKPILSLEDKDKLLKKRVILTDICDRMTKENPLANLFLGIVNKKLGNIEESIKRNQFAKIYLESSEYWKSRFSALNLGEVMVQAGAA